MTEFEIRDWQSPIPPKPYRWVFFAVAEELTGAVMANVSLDSAGAVNELAHRIHDRVAEKMTSQLAEVRVGELADLLVERLRLLTVATVPVAFLDQFEDGGQYSTVPFYPAASGAPVRFRFARQGNTLSLDIWASADWRVASFRFEGA